MAALIVITDRDTALGFRLAGVEVAEVSAKEEAAARLMTLLRAKDPGIVIYNDEYRTGLPEKSQIELEESVSPVFYAVPVAQASGKGEPRERYLARLLRRAIGYQLKLKR
ncbi:MAG TPA: V-type ATP synthase subunit F [Nitrospira sp.]|nr:V-type ATP synthase subunit F [Nitrospira sp.]